MMCACVSQAFLGSRSLGWRGLKSGPAHTGADALGAPDAFGARGLRMVGFKQAGVANDRPLAGP
jgi:hypothetical protein